MQTQKLYPTWILIVAFLLTSCQGRSNTPLILESASLDCPGQTCPSVSWAPDSEQFIINVNDLAYEPFAIVSADLTKVEALEAQLAATRPTAKDSLTFAALWQDFPEAAYAQPAWSPHGAEIAFYLYGKTEDYPAIYLVNRHSGVVTKTVSLSYLSPLESLGWSQDGQQLIYADFDQATRALWIMAFDIGQGKKQALKEITYPAVVALAPAGQYVAYISGEEAQDVYLLNLADGTEKNLTNNGGDEIENNICWSPNGQWLVVIAQHKASREPRSYLFQVERASTLLIDQEHFYISCAWSPDGQWLILSELFALTKLRVNQEFSP